MNLLAMSRASFSCILLLACICLHVFGQAPGDHDPSCREGLNRNNHIFPAEWRILVDTYDYPNIYDANQNPPPVWVAHDGDGDSINWQQFVGGICTWNLRTCSGQATQDNWLFSQYISYEGAKEVFFNVSFNFNECTPRPFCTRPYVTLYRYDRNTMATEVQRTNPSNYESNPLLGTLQASRLDQSGSSRQVEDTRSLTRPASSNGFYLGVRDEGTCGQVVRLIVYYVVCPGRVDGLVTYPETGLPVQGSSDFIFDAVCASNSFNTTTLQVRASSSTSSCSIIAPGGARCVCNAGYIRSGDGASCQACGAGMYRAVSDSSCSPCPANTVTDAVAASECSCVDGFYRTPQEGPATACTEPPGACTNIRVDSTTGSTITASWSRPAITGRSDYFYRVWRSDPENIGMFVQVIDNRRDTRSTVTYPVTGLEPFTSYIVRVSTHNGVSEQDPDGHLRQCEVTTMTAEAVPGLLEEVSGFCNVIVWQAPAKPNGVITGYEVLFSNNAQPQTRQANENLHLTAAEQRENETTFQVRAINSAGSGALTTPQLVCPGPCLMEPIRTNATSDSITISWSRPNLIGTSQSITYNITVGDRTINDIRDAGTVITREVSELTPFTTYTLTISATNGENSEECRTVAKTEGKESTSPIDPIDFCQVLVWNPPASPNGILSGYYIQFSELTETKRINNSEQTFYMTTAEEQAVGGSVRIGARNHIGDGRWTDISHDCSGVAATAQSADLFGGGIGVEASIVIIVLCTVVITLVIATMLFLPIALCIRKRSNPSTSDTPTASSKLQYQLT